MYPNLHIRHVLKTFKETVHKMNLIFRVISLGLILKNKHIIVLKKNLSSHQEKTEILNSLIVSDLHQLLGITWEGVKSFNSFSWIHFIFVFSKKTAMSKGTCPFHMKTKFTLEGKKVGIKGCIYPARVKILSRSCPSYLDSLLLSLDLESRAVITQSMSSLGRRV